jgi:pyruvate kinase
MRCGNAALSKRIFGSDTLVWDGLLMRREEHTMQTVWNEEAAVLLESLQDLVSGALALEKDFAQELAAVDADRISSARNLVHYLSLRQTDIRPLQDCLGRLGLSSLGRLESHVLVSLQAVTRVLTRLSGLRRKKNLRAAQPPVDFGSGPALLQARADELLGCAEQRAVRIMVTMPSEAATNYTLVHNLVAAGMDVMRINCAHDGPQQWQGMIDNLGRASASLGKSCRIYADLAGPKMRTGSLRPAGRLLTLSLQRDEKGAVIEPARVWLQTEGAEEQGFVDDQDKVLPLTGGLLDHAAVGDVLRVRDCRGVNRRLTLVKSEGGRWLAEGVKRVYLESGAGATLYRGKERIARGEVGLLPETVLPLQLACGDMLALTRSQDPGGPELRDSKGRVAEPASIPCSLEEAFAQVKPGERVCFDDGKIYGTVQANDGERMTVRITTGSTKGQKLAEGKGINFPDTSFSMPSLTAKDLADLDFVVHRVDMIGLSFVHGPEDVLALQERLVAYGMAHIGVVLKIENCQAFEHLPQILLAGLRMPHLGVMVARGDLAAEMGFDRLAEVQEEILWLCEAAHVPVIWATQVLEGMAKNHLPSRAEITDAAMSGRAECVMLNKGPFIVDTVEFLGNILERMQSHQNKKRAMLRRLAVSDSAV